jgi:hypothetical protein
LPVANRKDNDLNFGQEETEEPEADRGTEEEALETEEPTEDETE